ncbi:MAG: diaminopimelate epimerase [Butyricicoccaceae bacterium]
MKLNFTKMHGCGNDYIYFNCFEQNIDNPEELAIRLSDRHFGIGGDGVILICPSDIADAKMRMFNADGSEGKMCGNGTRCIGKFMYDNGLVTKPEMTLETLSGIKLLKFQIENGEVATVTVDMGPAILNPAEIPTKFTGDTAVSVPLEANGETHTVTCVSMGNPHCVLFVDDVDSLDLEKIGPAFENHPMFPERTNTEFVRVIDDHTLQMRVWERGSGETWACGTGACAVAVAAALNGICPKGEDILIHLRGGDLTIRYTDEAVFLTGSATKVFEGSIDA